MIRTKSRLLLAFCALVIIIITNSCDNEYNNSEDINDLIETAGHLDELEHYDPMQVGDPVVTEITEDGVEYRKTETNYKYAQKFDNQTQVSFSNKKNVEASNDIYLGAIIQGKYWRNDGELISIGNFSRRPMTITINGVDIDGTNSYEVSDPSNATMTDAINWLTNTQDFTANANNYKYESKIAYTKQQVGLSFGIHPSWIDNIGFDFGIGSTKETNTAYVYFKQVYYTMSAELPAQPSDFFENDVDLDALKSKISSENPAGYISSVDYGRVVLVKMTSNSSKVEMQAAIGVVFNNLDIEAGIEYQSIIGNSDFKAQIYGGSSSSIITNLPDVITQINEGLVIEDLQDAVPIAFHVNYLDGGSFNTGSLVEYTETEYEILKATSMVINKVTFTQLPNMEAGYWDTWSSYPDVYLGISELNGSEWESVASYNDQYFNEVTSSMLENGEISWNINFEITDFSTTYAIDAWDYNSLADDDFMGDIQFSVNTDIINSGVYPSQITLYNSDSNVRAILNLLWQ